MSDQEIIGPGDEFDDPFTDEPFNEPKSGMSRRAKLFAGGAIAIGLIAVLAVGWFAFQQGIRSGAEEAAPVVSAIPEPFKRKPADPGGLDVPHQDKLVFNRLAPGQVQEPVERLLPPPEEPAERPQAPTPAPPSAAAPADLPERVIEATPPPSPVPVPEPEVVTAPPSPPAPPAPPVSSETKQAAATPPAVPAPFVRETEPKAAPKPEASPTPAPPKPAAQAGKAWKIQLAAVSSEASAQSEWAKMKAKNSSLLGALALNIQTVKLDRGTFYRIQAGPVADGDSARALCAKLKTRNQDCLVVAP